MMSSNWSHWVIGVGIIMMITLQISTLSTRSLFFAGQNKENEMILPELPVQPQDHAKDVKTDARNEMSSETLSLFKKHANIDNNDLDPSEIIANTTNSDVISEESPDKKYAIRDNDNLNPSKIISNNITINNDMSSDAPPDCNVDISLNQTFCCAQNWEHNLDLWWQHHPDWEVSKETNETYCFSRIADPKRAEFLRDTVYPLQWQSDCSHVYASLQTSSGYAASIGMLGKAFLTSLVKNRTTFNWSRRVEDFIWRYANQNGTGICPSADMECYFLKLSNCPTRLKQNDGWDNEVYKSEGNEMGNKILWLRAYLARTKLWVRRRVFNLLQTIPRPEQPCSVLHVRRTDVALELKQIKKRHYFPLSDYLNKTNHFNILLLTDDDSAIQELLDFHATERNWTYIPRKRFTGPEGGWLGFFPSGDVIQEMVVILAEMKLASTCQKLVHTRSGFAKMLVQEMKLSNYDKNIETIRIDAGRQPNNTFYIAPDEFFRRIDEKKKSLKDAYQQNESQII